MQRPSCAGASDVPIDGYGAYLQARVLAGDGNLAAALPELTLALADDPDSVYLHVALAAIYAQLGDSERAYTLLRTALQLQPDNIEAQLLLAELLYQRNGSGDRVRALLMLHHVVAQQPERAELSLQLSQLHVLDHDYAQAGAVVNELLSHNPDNILALLQQAKIYILQTENKQAEKIYRHVISLVPQSRRAYVGLGQILIQDNQPDAALKLYQVAAQQTDDPVYFNHLRASLLANLNRYPAALAILDQLLQQDAQDYAAMFKIGLVYLQQQRWAEAQTFLLRSAAVKPSAKTNYWLGYAMEQQQQWTSALAEYRQVAAPEYLHYAALERAASVYAQQGDFAQAAAIVEQLLLSDNAQVEITSARDKDFVGIYWSAQPLLYLQLAVYYDAQKKPLQVIHALQRGIAKYPQSAQLYYACGIFYAQQGKQQLMEQNMRSTLAINKDHAGALNYLAYTYAESGKHLDEALPLAQRAVAIDKKAVYVDTLGWVYYKYGRLKLARQQLELASRLSPNDALIQGHLADVYMALKLKKLARTIYVGLLKKSPNNRVLQQKLKELDK